MLPESLLDDEETLEIEGTSWSGPDLALNMKVLSTGKRWLVSCVGASDWCIRERISEGLQVSDDDPVLWRLQFALHTAYFSGKPDDPYHAACDLLSVVPCVIEIPAIRLAEILATGSGSLGTLPVPAIRLCEPIMQKHGMKLYHLGRDQSETSTVCAALLFGDSSFVVAERFVAEPLS